MKNLKTITSELIKYGNKSFVVKGYTVKVWYVAAALVTLCIIF